MNQKDKHPYYSQWYLGIDSNNLWWVGYLVTIPPFIVLLILIYKLRQSIQIMLDPLKNITHNILSLIILRVLQVYLVWILMILSFRIYFISIGDITDEKIHKLRPVFPIYKFVELIGLDLLRLMLNLILYQFIALILLIDS